MASIRSGIGESMEDRYLFKAKRTDNGEWVQGYLVYDNRDKLYRIIMDIQYSTGTCITTDNAPRVDSSTICQCTGLKDKNGKLIWENDIVKRVDRRNNRYIFHEQPSMNCKVVWTYNYGFDTLPSCGYFDKSDGLECEVIGNIFDNLELLKVGD